MVNRVRSFFKQDVAVGILLLVAGLLALVLANSPLNEFYDMLLSVLIKISIGTFTIDKPIILWINDGLMTLFFLMIGLEIKRELIEGELSSFSQVILPAAAAIGGMVVPTLFYLLFNYGDSANMRGWAIPAATDIAFSLGVLAMLGSRIPVSIKIFLMALAIIDDFGAIIIIALFYTEQLSTTSILSASMALAVLIAFNLFKVSKTTPYLVVGIIMWACVLKSGVHATLAGVLLAFTIPLKAKDKTEPSPARTLEKDLHNVVNFVVLPLFAFANSGFSISVDAMKNLSHPVPMGIMFGLFFGKQLGVYLFSWITVKLGAAKLPMSASWAHVYGASVLCGIGFTMSLFIASLAFETGYDTIQTVGRIAILVGSAVSAIVGYLILYFVSKYDNAEM